VHRVRASRHSSYMAINRWQARFNHNSKSRFVARQGVLHQRMHSPIGRKAQHSATLLGTPLSKLSAINKKMAWTIVNNSVFSDSDISNMNVIRELLHIKHNFANMTLYSKDEIDFILDWSIVV